MAALAEARANEFYCGLVADWHRLPAAFEKSEFRTAALQENPTLFRRCELNRIRELFRP